MNLVNDLFSLGMYGMYIAYFVNENMDKSILLVCLLSMAVFLRNLD